MKGHPRAIEARERKAAASSAKKEAEARAKEDAKWADNDKHIAARQARKAEADAKTEEKLKRKQENRQLEEEEAQRLIGTNKGKQAAAKKMTRAEIALRQLQLRQEQEKAEKATKPETEDLMQPNINHIIREQQYDAMLAGEDRLDVSGMDAALAGLSAGDTVDRHPERRAKAAYKAYEEEWIPRIKEEFPGLRMSQIKERIFKQWQKAPENPRNQAAPTQP